MESISRLEMFDDEPSQSLPGIFNLLRVTAAEPVFAVCDWLENKRSSMLFELLNHEC